MACFLRKNIHLNYSKKYASLLNNCVVFLLSIGMVYIMQYLLSLLTFLVVVSCFYCA